MCVARQGAICVFDQQAPQLRRSVTTPQGNSRSRICDYVSIWVCLVSGCFKCFTYARVYQQLCNPVSVSHYLRHGVQPFSLWVWCIIQRQLPQGRQLPRLVTFVSCILFVSCPNTLSTCCHCVHGMLRTKSFPWWCTDAPGAFCITDERDKRDLWVSRLRCGPCVMGAVCAIPTGVNTGIAWCAPRVPCGCHLHSLCYSTRCWCSSVCLCPIFVRAQSLHLVPNQTSNVPMYKHWVVRHV